MTDISDSQRIYEDGGGFDGNPVYTPIEPGQPAPDPIPVVPPPPVTSPVTTIALPVAAPIPQRAPTSLPAPSLDGEARYSVEDYAAALAALLPRGRAWPDDPDSTQQAVLRGLAASLERLDADASGLLATSLPGSISPMLPEWEATLGLPDPCLGGTPSFADRAAQVASRFGTQGGLSRQRYIDFAAALGFDITITTYSPFRVGRTPIDNANAIGSPDWYFVWGVTVVDNHGGLAPSVLMCGLERIKPAETKVILLS